MYFSSMIIVKKDIQPLLIWSVAELWITIEQILQSKICASVMPYVQLTRLTCNCQATCSQTRIQFDHKKCGHIMCNRIITVGNTILQVCLGLFSSSTFPPFVGRDTFFCKTKAYVEWHEVQGVPFRPQKEIVLSGHDE